MPDAQRTATQRNRPTWSIQRPFSFETIEQENGRRASFALNSKIRAIKPVMSSSFYRGQRFIFNVMIGEIRDGLAVATDRRGSLCSDVQ